MFDDLPVVPTTDDYLERIAVALEKLVKLLEQRQHD